MRKLIFFTVSGIGIWWYIYKHSNINAKGLKRFVLSLKLAYIVIVATLGFPLGASASNGKGNNGQVDAYTPPLIPHTPHVERPYLPHGLFSSKQQGSETNPNAGSSGGSGSTDSDSLPPENVCKPCEKQTEPAEHPYQLPIETPKESKLEDENNTCEDTNRLVLAVSRDGSITKINSDQVRDKGLHAPDFLKNSPLKNTFDISEAKNLSYEDRLEFLRDKSNLPDEVVHETQDEIKDFLSAEDTILVPGYISARKDEGTVFLNPRLGKFGFRDKYTSEYRTGGDMSESKMRRLAESGFHLFPDAGSKNTNPD